MKKIIEVNKENVFAKSKLCFVGNDEKSFSNNYKSICLYFTNKDIKKEVWGHDWNLKYNSNKGPIISKKDYKNFYIVYIKDFITEENNGVETFTYQKDGWEINKIMSPKNINSGFGGWLLKETKNKKCDDLVLSSNNTFDEIMDKFKNYNIKIYQYE